VRHRLVIGCAIAGVAAAVVAGLLVSHSRGSGTGPKGDPAAFAAQIVALVVADDYATAWDSLNRAHQQVAPRSEYVACERQSPLNARLASSRVVRVVDRSVRIPGTTGKVPVKAVTLRLRIVSRASGRSETFRHTFTVVGDGTQWTWILTPKRYALYRDDACATT